MIIISAFDITVAVGAFLVVAVMAYGFGWCDGRDAIRRSLRRTR